MKKGGSNALEVVSDQLTNLKQRLKTTRDHHEEELLQKRICNLESVLNFLSASYSVPPAKEPHTYGRNKVRRQLPDRVAPA